MMDFAVIVTYAMQVQNFIHYLEHFLACVFPALLSAEVFAFSARPSLSLSTKAVLDSAKDIRVLRNLSRGLAWAGRIHETPFRAEFSKARSKNAR